MKSLNFESDDFDFDFFDDLAAFSVISFAPSRHQDIKLCCLKTFTVYPTYSWTFVYGPRRTEKWGYTVPLSIAISPMTTGISRRYKHRTLYLGGNQSTE